MFKTFAAPRPVLNKWMTALNVPIREYTMTTVA
jgi:hypothetical protein